MRNALAWPQCEAQTRLEIEECDGTELELLANYALSLKAQAIPIEPNSCFEIANADRKDTDSRFHLTSGFAV